MQRALALPLVERACNAGFPLHTGKTDSLLYKLFLTLAGGSVGRNGFVGIHQALHKTRMNFQLSL
jgi:hypothetical protein